MSVSRQRSVDFHVSKDYFDLFKQTLQNARCEGEIEVLEESENPSEWVSTEHLKLGKSDRQIDVEGVFHIRGDENRINNLWKRLPGNTPFPVKIMFEKVAYHITNNLPCFTCTMTHTQNDGSREGYRVVLHTPDTE